MPAPLLELHGLLHGERVLMVDDVIDMATVDASGRVMLPMFEVLALARIDVQAHVLLVHHADGSSHALRIADVIGGHDVFLQLSPAQPWGATGAASVAWRARLRINDVVPVAPVISVSAMSFASFVGLS